MVKKLSNLFKKVLKTSESSLETDAAIVAVVPQNNNEPGTDHEANTSQENMIDRIDSRLQRTLGNSQTESLVSSSIGEVNNVQNVYNFTGDGIHIGNTMIIHNKNENQQKKIKENNTSEEKLEDIQSEGRIKLTPSIREMMKCHEKIDERFLNEISNHVGWNYRSVMRSLGIENGVIETIEMDHFAYGHKEIIFNLLLDWTRSNYSKANIGKLARTLWRENCRDCVVEMEQIWIRNKAGQDT